jgi:hypothetical protein
MVVYSFVVLSMGVMIFQSLLQVQLHLALKATWMQIACVPARRSLVKAHLAFMGIGLGLIRHFVLLKTKSALPSGKALG